MSAIVIPDTMVGIVASAAGGPDVLGPKRFPVPKPRDGEVLIKVAAAGINGADLTQRKGGPPKLPAGSAPSLAGEVLGLEVSGTIAAAGPLVAGWRVGDPVCALVPGGGYAEYCTAPAVQCLPVPRGISLIDAGGLPEVAFTVWLNVFDLGRLQPGEKLLVHGGASGIGTHAIQLAHARGATVFATVGTPEKRVACEALGAKRAINYRAEDFVAAIAEATDGKGVDVILDMVGGSYMQRNFSALAPFGRLVMISFKGGRDITLDFSTFQEKQLLLTGSRLRPRPIAEKGRLAEALAKNVWPLIEAGAVRAVTHAVLPLEQAAKGHALMEASGHIGKVLLVPHEQG
jgi:putative PIG3 family NAD(P)H quinone oxidoreductase